MTRLVSGPFNRVEGDLEITLDIEDGRVAAAWCNAPLFRGFERILEGKDPRDALTITPRICGICSVSQSVAAARALAACSGAVMPENGARAAALIHAAENVADHLTHFYLFFMPDFAREMYADRPWFDRVAARFRAQAGSGAREATSARARLLHVMGILAGKWPHTLAIQPGGVTRAPDARDRMRLIAAVREFRGWLESALFGGPLEAFVGLDDEAALTAWRDGPVCDARLFLEAADEIDGLGFGPDRFISFGAYELAEGPLFARGVLAGGAIGPVPFDAITEDVAQSWMLGEAPLAPFDGATWPDPQMRAGYSWCKAPRLAGGVVETGAFARQAVDGHKLARDLLRDGRADARARVIGRLLEIARTVPAMEAWAAGLEPGARFIDHAPLPDAARGAGLCEAARGALGHWLVIEEGRIANYQIIAPTTWNFSPRDGAGVPGPVEAALVGAPARDGETTPVAVQHIVRSFDPCMVCTVH